jgi:predicted AAA+ superfamily ATPase
VCLCIYVRVDEKGDDKGPREVSIFYLGPRQSGKSTLMLAYTPTGKGIILTTHQSSYHTLIPLYHAINHTQPYARVCS